ncbi:MAG: hypothetical protein JEZ04_02150 [Spirochaetales bacterium]|nr:hypothetical protein [Spirochaetales bacterium]
MKRGFQLFLISILILAFFSGCATVEDEEYSFDESDEPVPYDEEEFPEWLSDVRRAEIIFAGSLPFTILVSNVGYGIYSMISSDAYDITNFTTTASMTNDEKLQILGIGAGISAGIALLDFILGLFEEEEDLE